MNNERSDEADTEPQSPQLRLELQGRLCGSLALIRLLTMDLHLGSSIFAAMRIKTLFSNRFFPYLREGVI